MIGTSRRPTAYVASICILLSLFLGRQALGARFAILVGNNDGHSGDPQLRFAETDTSRLAELLGRLGGFATGGTIILLGRTTDELRRSIAEVGDRLRSTPGEHLVLLYYSGHADAQALHMGSSTFPLTELREAVNALPAVTRVLILDACQAGVLTRPKGGQPGPRFDIELGAGEATKGLAILAAGSGSELAQESDQLRASVFTHYLVVGLSGLADRNRDGNVSLTEAFDYTADHTLAATLGTSTGPQHPTFRLDLAGRDDLVLTRPALSGTGYGHLRLDVPGWYFVRRGDGTIAAELVSRGDETLALEPGPYEVTRRERNALDVGTLNVGNGAAVAISQADTHRVAFGQMVRKGEGPAAAYGFAVATSVRSSLEDLGPSAGAAVAGRADLSAVSFELRLGLGRAQQTSQRFSSSTWDLSAALAVLRMRDLGPVTRASNLTWAFGCQAGVSYMMQAGDDGSRRVSWNPFAGPVVLAELSVGRRLFVRADLGIPIYALRVQMADLSTSTAWRPAVAFALGAGSSF